MGNLPAMKRLLLLSFYLNLLGCNGCKDLMQQDINQLPPITQDGANTFGAGCDMITITDGRFDLPL